VTDLLPLAKSQKLQRVYVSKTFPDAAIAALKKVLPAVQVVKQ
jgi:hypothetical protein